MAKHVLVIADFADNEKLSLEKSRDITQPMDASILVVKFINCQADKSLSVEQQIAANEQLLSSQIESVFEDSNLIDSKVVALEDEMVDWVVDYCNQNAVDFVIKTGHRSESLFHHPSDWHFIRHLPCPILIISHEKWKSQANILLTIDLAHDEAVHRKLNHLTLSWGQDWSKINQSDLHAVFSIPIAKALLELDTVDESEVLRKKAPQAKEKLVSLLEEAKMTSVVPHITAGPPEKTIPHLANELHSDLVILGTVGREGIGGWLFGNTAEKVLHKLRTDCLVVKLPLDEEI